MSGWLIPHDNDRVERTDTPIAITVGDQQLRGIAGQTLAGILLSNGISSWRVDSHGKPRGLFCGIGACFDCLATVNGHTDVRLCRRRARDGDVIVPQTRFTP